MFAVATTQVTLVMMKIGHSLIGFLISPFVFHGFLRLSDSLESPQEQAIVTAWTDDHPHPNFIHPRRRHEGTPPSLSTNVLPHPPHFPSTTVRDLPGPVPSSPSRNAPSTKLHLPSTLRLPCTTHARIGTPIPTLFSKRPCTDPASSHRVLQGKWSQKPTRKESRILPFSAWDNRQPRAALLTTLLLAFRLPTIHRLIINHQILLLISNWRSIAGKYSCRGFASRVVLCFEARFHLKGSV